MAWPWKNHNKRVLTYQGEQNSGKPLWLRPASLTLEYSQTAFLSIWLQRQKLHAIPKFGGSDVTPNFLALQCLDLKTFGGKAATRLVAQPQIVDRIVEIY